MTVGGNAVAMLPGACRPERSCPISHRAAGWETQDELHYPFVIARARSVRGDPYVDGPLPARLRAAFLDRFACIHMSGLLGAVAHDRWPRWFPRRESQTYWRPA